MNKRSAIFYGGFALSLAFLAFVLSIRSRTEPDGAKAASASTVAEEPGAIAPAGPPVLEEREVAMARDADIVITDADRTTFLESPVAAKWMDDFGYTQGDIVRAQRKLRAQNVANINDPSTIMRALPPRHVATLSVTGLDVPPEAHAGKPIPITMRGKPPSSSYVFTRFNTLVQGEIIRIRAVGHSEGETASGPGEEITLKGQLDPLPAGEYRIEISELGPAGSFPLVVRP